MSKLKETAVELYKSGYSCSEAIVRAAYNEKFTGKNFNIQDYTKIASVFSGGMSSGCLCGALAGAQIIIGHIFGREDKHLPKEEIAMLGKKFIDDFKIKRKTTCCRALSAKYDFASPERRQNCTKIVGEAAEILESLIKEHSNVLKTV